MGYPFHRHPYTVLLVVRRNGLEVERPCGQNCRELESSGSAVKESNLFRSSYHQWAIYAGTRENGVKVSV